MVGAARFAGLARPVASHPDLGAGTGASSLVSDPGLAEIQLERNIPYRAGVGLGPCARERARAAPRSS